MQKITAIICRIKLLIIDLHNKIIKVMISSKLYTIGYGNRSAQEVFRLVRELGIDTLVDVRSIPYSRFRPAFNRNSLLSQAKDEGVAYVFKGVELGAKFNGTYPSNEVLRSRPEYAEGLRYLISLLEAGYNVAIMCCELDHLCCHRYSLVGEDMFQLGYPVVHINKQGKLAPHEGLTE